MTIWPLIFQVLECSTQLFKLDYEPLSHAGNPNLDKLRNMQVYGNFHPSTVAQTVTGLHAISRKIWDAKTKNGRFSMNNEKLAFELNEETHRPLKVSLSKTLQSHRLVETFMCAANEAVAVFLNKNLPNGGTLLRRHLNDKNLTPKLQICKVLNLPQNLANLDFNEFLNHIPSKIKPLATNFLIKSTEKSMFYFYCLFLSI